MGSTSSAFQIFPASRRSIVSPIGVFQLGGTGAEQPRQAAPARGPGGGARLFPGAGGGTASAHPSASTVETAPAVSACQSSSPPARFSSVPVFQAPRIPT